MKALGLAPAINQMNMTVQQVYEAWSERAYVKLGDSAKQGYRTSWNLRISRYAEKKMRDMTLDDWQSILDEDAEEGRSQSLIQKDVTVIKGLYAYAAKRDIVGKDYSAYLEIPSVGPKVEKGAFTDLQLVRLEGMAKEGYPWADTVLMMCFTGFRITEFLTLTRFNYHPEYGGYLQGGIKTHAGKDRIVPVHPRIAPYVRAWLGKDGETLINRDGKAIKTRWYRSCAFSPIAKELGVENATPHWCRHTFASLLHRAGTNPLTAKWLMGHSTEQDITEHYTHETIEELVAGVRLIRLIS